MTAKNPFDPFDDTMLFAAESEKKDASQELLPPWILLIVDDEKQIHNMTKMVLADYRYNGRKLKFLHAFSGAQAKEMILQHKECALILLDVVMETSHAGLDVAKFIRQEAGNSTTRIILRTGQPGKAPEKDVILDYDINDYKDKTELTSQKLFTTITSAIRSFEQLTRLEEQKLEILDQNRRLNREIARRIVAESNLTRYNRTLERTLEEKKQQLEEALMVLKDVEQRLKESRNQPFIQNLSAEAMHRIVTPAGEVVENLTLINNYRSAMTALIEKYETLLQMINMSKSIQQTAETRHGIEKIKRFRDISQMDQIFIQYPELIQNAVEKMHSIEGIATDIKRFIRISRQKFKPLNIRNTLEKALAKIFPQKMKQIDINTDFNDAPEIKASQGGLMLAFKAVLKNALEAVMPQGIISVSLLSENNFIVVTISDNGKGISLKDLPRVFDPYFSSHIPTPETFSKGLGLFLAKSAISNHFGTIEIESNQGEGTTVTIRIPLTTTIQGNQINLRS